MKGVRTYKTVSYLCVYSKSGVFISSSTVFSKTDLNL
jgi:hypothetical protein